MATRQYVGARYVPKVFEHNGSSNWVSGIAYEPLTIVTYLNNSYTSKKPVPSSVGSPNLNPEYWANTGDYSGTVSNLTQLVEGLQGELTEFEGTVNGQITTINGNVSALKTYNQYLPTKLLCIGDSYGMKIANNWANFLKAYMGLDNDHFTNKCTGSSGFIGNTGVKTFYQQLTEPEDKDTYTHIVIVGGFNDAYDANGNMQNNADMLTAITQCGNYIKANYPNAKVWLGMPANVCNIGNVSRASTMRTQCAQMKNVYAFYGAQQGWAIMRDIQNCMHDLVYFNTSDVTYECVFHPNSEGGQNMARCILSYILGGEFMINRTIVCTYVGAEGISLSGSFTEQQYDEKTKLMLTSNLTITFATPITFAESTNIIEICSAFEHKIVYPRDNNMEISINAKCKFVYNDNTHSYGTCAVMFNANTVKIWGVPDKDEGKTISQIIILPFTIDCDTLFN